MLLVLQWQWKQRKGDVNIEDDRSLALIQEPAGVGCRGMGDWCQMQALRGSFTELVHRKMNKNTVLFCEDCYQK